MGPLRTHFELAARRGLTKFVGREREIERGEARARASAGRPRADRRGGGRGGHRQVTAVLRVQGDAAGGCKVLEAYSVSHGKASA